MRSVQNVNLFRVAIFCLLIPAGCAHQVVAPPAPPPPSLIAELSSAKTVFVSNLGAERFFRYNIPGGASVCYNEFYASLKQWGHYTLVDDPAHADLIFALKCTETPDDVEHTGPGLKNSDYTVTRYDPMLNLEIVKPGWKVPLFTFTALAGRGSNIPKGQVAFAASIDGMTEKLMTMVGQSVTLPAATTLVGAVGPVPPAVLQAKNVYLRKGNASVQEMQSMTAALTAWGHYTFVDSPAKADVIFEVRDDLQVEVNVYTASDQFQLWTVDDPSEHGYESRKKMLSQETNNMMTAMKALVAAQ